MGKDWCAAQKINSYAWFFDRQLPGDDCGAWHSSDLWYWFGTLPNCWRPMEQKDYDLRGSLINQTQRHGAAAPCLFCIAICA